MALRATEMLHPKAEGLDALASDAVAAILLNGQIEALGAVASATNEIAQGGKAMAQAIFSGANLVYAAAGSSGLMAAADALELTGTFGIPTSNIHILMAGGLPSGAEMPGHTEDDEHEAQQAAAVIGKGDAVICVSASGSTPYAVAIAKEARARGATAICIANNKNAPMFEVADVAICLPTPPEVIAGSTRMGAGTAQKVALNMMSTIMGIELGHVHDGMMVNLIADNDKLRARAAGMVSHIAQVDEESAEKCLAQAGGAVKPAVLIASGAATFDHACELLENSRGSLRAALTQL